MRYPIFLELGSTCHNALNNTNILHYVVSLTGPLSWLEFKRPVPAHSRLRLPHLRHLSHLRRLISKIPQALLSDIWLSYNEHQSLPDSLSRSRLLFNYITYTLLLVVLLLGSRVNSEPRDRRWRWQHPNLLSSTLLHTRYVSMSFARHPLNLR